MNGFSLQIHAFEVDVYIVHVQVHVNKCGYILTFHWRPEEESCLIYY